MRVKLNTTMAGPKGNFSAGKELTISNGFTVEELQEMVDSKHATSLVPEKSGYETGVAQKSQETAAITADESKQVVENTQETTSNESREELKTSGKMRMKKVGGGFYDIIDENGNVINGKPLKKAAAQAFLKGK